LFSLFPPAYDELSLWREMKHYLFQDAHNAQGFPFDTQKGTLSGLELYNSAKKIFSK
jgi:hypothetical protein